MPIKNSALIEKRSNFKKDDWRGHPSSTKPRFSDRFSNISDDPRKNRTASVRNKSLEGVDIFSCYGEKYRLLKESTWIWFNLNCINETLSVVISITWFMQLDLNYKSTESSYLDVIDSLVARGRLKWRISEPVINNICRFQVARTSFRTPQVAHLFREGNATFHPWEECSLYTHYIGIRYPVESFQRLDKLCMSFPCLAFSTFGKAWEFNTVLPDSSIHFACCAEGQRTGDFSFWMLLFIVASGPINVGV